LPLAPPLPPELAAIHCLLSVCLGVVWCGAPSVFCRAVVTSE
jgi:hypothetical protein